MNQKKIILDLCGGTGAWSLPYKNAGYNVKVITLPNHDVMKYEEYKNFIPEIYGILAAPTCTHFSLARTRAKTPRDLRGGFELIKRCLGIIYEVRLHEKSSLKFWALENPLGYLRQIIGKPSLTFNPNDYGDNYTKKTDLWGYFNHPKKNYRELTKEEAEACRTNLSLKLKDLPPGYVVPAGFNRLKARRSMTSAKFAEAFYKANK